MSWDAADRTAEYGSIRPTTPGEHRRHRARYAGVIAGAVLLALAVAGTMLSPVLTGWPSDQPAGATSPSTVDRRGLEPTTAATSATPTAAAPATTRPSGTPAGSPALEARVVSLTNAERARAGCPALRLDLRLRAAARGHSSEMARYGTWGHTGRDGSTPGQRMARAGYTIDGGWAENIARGYASAEAVMRGWMDSADHRANILNCGLRAIGVGVARASNGGLYWTQDFGTH